MGLPFEAPLPKNQCLFFLPGRFLRNEVNLAHTQWDWSQQDPDESREEELVEIQKKSDRNLLTLLQVPF